MPVGELLEKAFAYRELVSGCCVVIRERGDAPYRVPLSEALQAPILGHADSRRNSASPSSDVVRVTQRQAIGGVWRAAAVERRWDELRRAVSFPAKSVERGPCTANPTCV